MDSEGTGLTTITSEEWLTHPGSVGRAVSGAIHILDEEGEELPSWQVGTICSGGGASQRGGRL